MNLSRTSGIGGPTGGSATRGDAGDDDGWGAVAITLGALLLFVAGVALLSWSWETPSGTDPQAQRLAGELVDKMDEAGMQQPDLDTVARVYGTDGGAACVKSGSELARSLAAFNLMRTGEVNQRPGLLDPRTFEFERLMIDTYCPARADEFDAFVRDLRLRRTREALV